VLASLSRGGTQLPAIKPDGRKVITSVRSMNAKCERISVDPAESNGFDRPLIKAVARARRWSNQVLSGQVPSIRAIARQERIAPRYVRDLLPLAFLSPRIIEAILEGRQPPDLTVVGLTRRIDLPLLWSVQERALGLRDSNRLVPSESADRSGDATSGISD
jgi:hypothetical protein